jgi:fatty acid desaturase
MRIPFSTPDIPELDALPDSERGQLMFSYTTSASAKRLIRLVQASMFLSMAFLLLAINLGGTWRLLFGVAAPISLVLGVVVYRVGATRALRKLLSSA